MLSKKTIILTIAALLIIIACIVLYFSVYQPSLISQIERFPGLESCTSRIDAAAPIQIGNEISKKLARSKSENVNDYIPALSYFYCELRKEKNDEMYKTALDFFDSNLPKIKREKRDLARIQRQIVANYNGSKGFLRLFLENTDMSCPQDLKPACYDGASFFDIREKSQVASLCNNICQIVNKYYNSQNKILVAEDAYLNKIIKEVTSKVGLADFPCSVRNMLAYKFGGGDYMKKIMLDESDLCYDEMYKPDDTLTFFSMIDGKNCDNIEQQVKKAICE